MPPFSFLFLKTECLKYLQFLHQELHFPTVAITLSRRWNQQKKQIPCHHFIMQLSVRQPLCDSLESVPPKSTARLRAAGFDSRDSEEQPRGRCGGKEWWQLLTDGQHLQKGDVLGDNSLWKRLKRENYSKLVSRGKLNFVTHWNLQEVKAANSETQGSQRQLQAEGCLWGVQWAQLKLLNSGTLVWVWFSS